MQTVTETFNLYTYDELDADAKERARSWYVEGYDAFEGDFAFDDFERICEIMGVTLSTHAVKLMGGGTRYDPTIYYSLSYSQGDGACFEGSYSYVKGAVAKIKAYAPQDTVLHGIANDLADIQRRNFYQLNATIRLSGGRYTHSGYMGVAVERDSPTYQDMTADAEEAVTQAMRDLADWLYRYLRAEYEYQTSEEAVAETILANEYTFTEDGDRRD